MNAVSGPVAEAIRSYREGVRGELSDLPASEISEILDDVTSHLEDLRGELGDDAGHDELVARLGTPQAYAAELRAAAGYPPAPPLTSTPVTGAQAAYVAVAVLVGSVLLVLLGGLWLIGGVFVGAGGFGVFLLAAAFPLAAAPALFGLGGGPSVPVIAALPVVRRFLAARPEPSTPLGAVAGFLASLQPAWWVLRAVLAAALVAGLIGVGIAGVLVVSLVTVPISVWLGFVSRRDHRWLWLVAPLNAFAGVVVVVFLAYQVPSSTYYAADDEGSASYAGPGLLQDGVPVEDIRPVDANGVPLEGVYLFDQNGRALDTYGSRCAEDYSGSGVTPYPRGTVTYDINGECVEVPPGPFAVAIPAPSTTTSTTTAPTTAPATPVPGTTTPAVPTEQAPPTG